MPRMTPPLLVKATQVENNTNRPKNGYAEKGKRDIKVSMMGEHMVDIYDTQVSKPREGVVGLREELIKKVPEGLHNKLKKVLQYGA